MPICGKDHSYNGWRNYETWSVNFFIDNDEGTQERAREMTREAIEGAEASKSFTKKEQAYLDLSDSLKEWVHGEEWTPDLDGLAGQLLMGALSEVDWYELASHYVDDFWEPSDDEGEEEEEEEEEGDDWGADPNRANEGGK